MLDDGITLDTQSLIRQRFDKMSLLRQFVQSLMVWYELNYIITHLSILDL